MSYADLLKDPRWQKKRLQILERDGWKCRACHDGSTTLHVHHLIYIKGQAPWDYKDSALIALCEDCHAMANARLFEATDYELELLHALRRCWVSTLGTADPADYRWIVHRLIDTTGDRGSPKEARPIFNRGFLKLLFAMADIQSEESTNEIVAFVNAVTSKWYKREISAILKESPESFHEKEVNATP
jgi:hypothetical protein